MRTIIYSFAILLSASIFCVYAFAQTHITVMPSTTVEVGEEVYFDAQHYQKTISDTLEFEWNFGDGYKMYIDTTDGYPFETGLCVMHHFMKPGVYTVKMTASYFKLRGGIQRTSIAAIDSVKITVTGDEPLKGFELLHAPFHGRVAQYLYATVPQGYSPSQVFVKVEKVGGGYSEDLVGTTMDTVQRFLLRNAMLPAGNYVVTAELKNGENVISRIREKLSKPYDGAPKVGINENNAFVLNGTNLFFPLGPWFLDLGSIPLWSRVSNTLHTEGYYKEHTPDTWVDYIYRGKEHNLMTVGPTGWKGFKVLNNGWNKYYQRNSEVDTLVLYVQRGKNEEGLFAWCWDDEPESGGWGSQVIPQVYSAWDYRTRLEDPQHLTTCQMYGYDLLRYRNPWNSNTLSGRNYARHNAPFFGGKRHHIADFLTHDVYPLEAQEHASLKDSTRGVIQLWLECLDMFRWITCEHIPVGTCVETQDVTQCQKLGLEDLDKWDAGPTPEELRMELWGAIVHGMKYIIYFQHFQPTPPENISVLGELKEAVSVLTPMILSEPSTRVMTHNCTTRGNRVDIMVREYNGDVYVIAVRVTEPEGEWKEVHEPETITFELNTGINVPAAYDELQKYRWNYVKLNATEGQKDFSCTVPEGGIVPNSVIVAGVIDNAASKGYPDTLVDQFTKKVYPTALNLVGNLKYGYDNGNGNIEPRYTGTKGVSGTVNYSTGQIQFSFTNGIPAGSGFVQVAYAPANREARAIPIVGGVIHDELERNAVRIYRIPLSSGINEKENSPERCKLSQNYPNPFISSTKITFTLNKSEHASLIIYDIVGHEIATLMDEYKEAGTHTVEWNGTNSKGQQMVSGVYFYQLRTSNGFTNTRKLLLLK